MKRLAVVLQAGNLGERWRVPKAQNKLLECVLGELEHFGDSIHRTVLGAADGVRELEDLKSRTCSTVRKLHQEDVCSNAM